MPKLTGVFENFRALSHENIEDIKRWLNFPTEAHQIDNFLSNRLLYPQTIPMTEQEMEIDLAILREALRVNLQGDKSLVSLFYNSAKNTLTINEDFLLRFRPTQKLVWALADVLSLKETTNIFTRDWAGTHGVGSLITLYNPNSRELMMEVDSQKLNLNTPSRAVIPFIQRHTQVKIGEKIVPAMGGELGILIDLKPNAQ